ncbi:MAG: universal stress protein [Dehalococcoidia bacterium]|jgi:nucleotide-binding universal stress UspA family protein|nr:universal stress protein [Dehalococcoidia bacterium]
MAAVMTDPLQAKAFLVPLDGTDAAYGALVAACGVARKTRAAVHALYVIEVPRSLPIEADMVAEGQRGEEVLERAEELAAALDVRLEAELLQARQEAHVILDEAAERGADAIVIGLEYHRPYGRYELGKVATYVLERAPGFVWLIRYPVSDGEAPPNRPGQR